MSKEPVGGSPAAQILEPPKFRAIDAVMIFLALVSVTLVLVDIFKRNDILDGADETLGTDDDGAFAFQMIIVADAIITLIFLIDFIVETRGMRFGRIVRENWFDIVGLVPMAAFIVLEALFLGFPVMEAFTNPVGLAHANVASEAGAAASSGALLRLFRLVRIVRIVQAFSRFLRATNMTFGEQVTKRFFDKYRRIIVAELTTPIMVAGITATQEIVVRMKFLESAGQALDSKRPEIHAAVMEALEKNKIPNSFVAQPMVNKVIHDVETTVVNTVVDTLTGPELNKLTQEMIVEVLENFKKQLQSPEGKAMLKNMGVAPPEGKPVPAPPKPDPAALEGPGVF